LIVVDENESPPSFIGCIYENYTTKISTVDDDFSADNISYSILDGSEIFSIDNNGVIRIKDGIISTNSSLFSILSDKKTPSIDNTGNSDGKPLNANLVVQISDGLYDAIADVNINTEAKSCTVIPR